MQVCNDSFQLPQLPVIFLTGGPKLPKCEEGIAVTVGVILRTCLIVFLALPSLSLADASRPGMMEAVWSGNDGARAFKFRLPLHNWPPTGCASRKVKQATIKMPAIAGIGMSRAGEACYQSFHHAVLRSRPSL